MINQSFNIIHIVAPEYHIITDHYSTIDIITSLLYHCPIISINISKYGHFPWLCSEDSIRGAKKLCMVRVSARSDKNFVRKSDPMRVSTKLVIQVSHHCQGYWKVSPVFSTSHVIPDFCRHPDPIVC